MFRITNTKEDHTTDAARLVQLDGTGIYCDTTAAQYDRAAGLQDARAYHHHHPGSKTVYCASFAHYYRTYHLRNLGRISAEDGRYRIYALHREAYTQTMNNIVHREIEGMGGTAYLLAMTPGDFEAACTTIVAQVHSALLEVAVKIRRVYLNKPYEVIFDSKEDSYRYEEVASRCMGPGHTACLQALDKRAPDTWMLDDKGVWQYWRRE
ncbi:hypothetical protein IG631_00843 [Alternaria alternata]|nr:hypothetical protein IG631_00843 [Alternaria alternata]